MLRIFALSLLAAAPLHAQATRDCNTWVSNARNLAMPYEDATRTYAQGSIAFLLLDTGEPACCSDHLMVLYPDPEEPFRICQLISLRDGLGYYEIRLGDAQATYDPLEGLSVRIPAFEYGEVEAMPRSLDVTVNQQTGVLTASHGAP